QLTSTQHLDRFMRVMSTGFAALALMLAAIGLYGVLSFTVTQRRGEFGVRMALGADRLRIARLVMARVGAMILVGGAAGLIAALQLGQLARSQLFSVEGTEPVVLLGAVICTALVALAAGALPAWRATRVDPVVALRAE